MDYGHANVKHKKVEPTYTCIQWLGDNFEEFYNFFDHVTEWGGELSVSEWVQKFKGFTDHKVTLNQWVIVNDMSKKIKVIDHYDYLKQYAKDTSSTTT